LTTPAIASEIDQSLAHIMRYRNAFAHGIIIAEENNYILKYFESAPKRVIIDDEYWKKLEARFNAPWESLLSVETSLERDRL
jgi:hypothetical protein